MRAILLALCLALVAGAAAAEQHAVVPPQCRNLDGMIAHYQTMRARAKAMDSDLWVSRMNSQLARLEKHRKLSGCPEDPNLAAEVARQLNELLKLAAQGALTFFTMGAM